VYLRWCVRWADRRRDAKTRRVSKDPDQCGLVLSRFTGVLISPFQVRHEKGAWRVRILTLDVEFARAPMLPAPAVVREPVGSFLHAGAADPGPMRRRRVGR
jgi:hypothetical protein